MPDIYGNIPPVAGTEWKGNIFRMDFDEKPEAKWAIDPASGPEFHNFQQFATFTFSE